MWRQRLRALRQALSADEVAGRSLAICRNLTAFPPVQRARRIALYLPIHNEVDPTSLLTFALASGPTFYLPKVMAGCRELRLAPYRVGDPLCTGSFGIVEPAGGGPLLTAREMDVVCLPLLGCDRRGVRLGYGGGYYDQALAGQGAPPPWLLGLAYDFQVVAELPHGAHDVPLHGVAAEGGVWLRPGLSLPEADGR